MLSNLVKYCVDCFSLLFSVLVVLVTSPAASVSAWLADSSERLLSYAQQLVSEHPNLVVGPCVDSKASVAVWQRSCVNLGAALRLFVGSCVDLKTVCRLLEKSI